MSAQIHSGTSLLGNIALPDRYRIVRRIGGGGMATVWCAEDVLLGRRVAIKLLGEQFAYDESAGRRLEREARAAARLSGHRHVVTIYDVSHSEPDGEAESGRPFIVMEHLAGGTVADALRVGAVERETVLRWLREAASALDYAHSQGILHRDIKPGNLLLDHERVLHVADFGIARIRTEDTITAAGQLLGTAAYLSPEQALGRPATEASDRYALAVVAFELLVGERPFTAQHFAAQARQHIDQQPPRASHRNRNLTPAVDVVLARGMAKRAQERWDTATAFADALEAAVLNQPAAGRARGGFGAQPHGRTARRPLSPRQPPPVMFRGKPRPRAVALAALAAAALGVGAAIAGTTGGSQAPKRALTHAASRSTPGPAAARRPARRTNPIAAARPPGPVHPAPPAATPAPASATPPPSADALEARGHALMLSGSYTAAIDVLRHAIAAAEPGSLTDAYALYDMGRSLRLAGDPAAAAVILEKRLQIPNQTGVVRRELELALRALGAAARASGGAAAGPGHRHR